MTVANAPPGRASTVIDSSGVWVPVGPQKWVRCSGSVMQRNTSSRGASKTRRTRSTWSVIGVSCRRGLEGAEMGIEFVEALGPRAPARFHPVDRGVERLALEVAGPELGLPAAGDQPRPLEHLQVLGDPGERQGEGCRQLVHRQVPGRE